MSELEKSAVFNLSTTPLNNVDDPDFQRRKTAFFVGLAVSERLAMNFHREAGLLSKNEMGVREWGNVTGHCLVEAARVQVFADILGFDENLKHDLSTAAAMHDYFKKGEKEIVESDGMTWDNFSVASRQSTQLVIDKGVSTRVIKLMNAVGHETIAHSEAIASKPDLTDEEIAYLVIHYVDDYTINFDWAKGAEVKEGVKINDLDRRTEANEAKPRNRLLREYNLGYFQNETPFQAQRRVGHLIEQRLAQLISERAGIEIDPIDLPTHIDSLLVQKIQAIGAQK